MLKFDLNETDGIVSLVPEGPLAASDFDALRAVVDPYIERTGGLRGLVIEADPFPGWDGFAGLTAHLRFVREHQRLVRRVAVVSDGAVLSHLPQLASHFLAAELRHFPKAEHADALDWVRSA